MAAKPFPGQGKQSPRSYGKNDARKSGCENKVSYTSKPQGGSTKSNAK